MTWQPSPNLSPNRASLVFSNALTKKSKVSSQFDGLRRGTRYLTMCQRSLSEALRQGWSQTPKSPKRDEKGCRAEMTILKWFRETNGSVLGWLTGRFYAWCFKQEGKSKAFWLFTTTLAYSIMVTGWGLCIFLFYYVYMR
jgi:hypothetical protein